MKASNILIIVGIILIAGCQSNKSSENKSPVATEETRSDSIVVKSKPLVTEIYTADPSAHVFDGKIYVYPSHDYEAGVPEDDLGSHFDMRDYHVLSMDSVGGPVTIHDVALDKDQVPWVGRQMWAPDAAYKNGTYYLYFPAKDEKDIFRIGVATSETPYGPFEPQPRPIAGSYSIDPSVFEDSDGSYYMYFGGIWGGQLQRWATGTYQEEDVYPADSLPALTPRVAKLAEDMLEFAETPKSVEVLDENGNMLLTGDNDRRFFEAAWVHTYSGRYYLSYSTGDTHNIAYAIGDSPYGPFTYEGVILNPVLGWTNHHSIVEVDGKWYLFYHDSSLSGGKTHLRIVKVAELMYDELGRIKNITALPNMD